MAGKPNSRNWNDVQTAIATAAIVTTLGLWNLFATPSKTKVVQSSEPLIPPAEPPVESAPDTAASAPTALPQVKLMFAQATPQTSIQPAPDVQQAQTVKKKKNRTNNSSGGGSVTVTQTKTS
jgi:hypothetical protein